MPRISDAKRLANNMEKVRRLAKQVTGMDVQFTFVPSGPVWEKPAPSTFCEEHQYDFAKDGFKKCPHHSASFED